MGSKGSFQSRRLYRYPPFLTFPLFSNGCSVSYTITHLFSSSVFRYEAGKDSVLEVTRDAYKNCNTTNPLANYTDGGTKVKLDRSGPFYFISGADGHCEYWEINEIDRIKEYL
ncbi:unnamed protein product [Arabis nemorensis]|uniref:Phytocyanin domain-containing protein n=1 Tax=Arabis nemorensis TaxID=586526 RepID=A0A565C5L4_9BRAS|nr:unnamed protein product [Arabis nemorensis]